MLIVNYSLQMRTMHTATCYAVGKNLAVCWWCPS